MKHPMSLPDSRTVTEEDFQAAFAEISLLALQLPEQLFGIGALWNWAHGVLFPLLWYASAQRVDTLRTGFTEIRRIRPDTVNPLSPVQSSHRETVVKRQIQFEHVHPRFAKDAQSAACRELSDQLPDLRWVRLAGLGDSTHLGVSRRGLMCGSRPLPLAVSMSAGMGPEKSGFSARNCSAEALTLSNSFRLVGPRFEPLEADAS